MIIVRISGGLGNQLFQYAIGRALSLKLECELVLDTSFYPQQTLRKYELDKFHINARLATNAEINKAGAGSNFIARLIRKLGLTPVLHPSYIKELESIKYFKAIDNCKSGSYLNGYWQNPAYFAHCKKQLCEDFTPIKSISEQAQAWLLKIKATNSVSLHVRRGDYVQNAHTNSVHGTCTIEYYQKAVEHIQQKIETPIFYVFSDEIQWCKDNLSFIDAVCFVDDTQSAIDDLVLMQHCKANIIANSTFSWWGAWLSPCRDIQIAPRNWFNSNKKNLREIYPESWLIL